MLLVRHVVALDFSCGPLLGAVCAAFALDHLLFRRAGSVSLRLGWLCANHDVS